MVHRSEVLSSLFCSVPQKSSRELPPSPIFEGCTRFVTCKTTAHMVGGNNSSVLGPRHCPARVRHASGPMRLHASNEGRCMIDKRVLASRSFVRSASLVVRWKADKRRCCSVRHRERAGRYGCRIRISRPWRVLHTPVLHIAERSKETRQDR
jgi:hypothetical protein